MYFTAFVLGDEYYWTSLVWEKLFFQPSSSSLWLLLLFWQNTAPVS